LTIAYDGTDFAGWQVQPGQKTIQSMLERALQRVTKEQIRVIGSGRTDSGVHALAQVAGCTLPLWRDSCDRLAHALNANLPDTIVVTEAVDAADGFHAIRDAIGKRYRYQLQLGGRRDAFQHRYRWHLHGAFDIDRMRAAANRFVGKHDFASFQATGSDRKTTIRHVRACEISQQQTSTSEAMNLAIEVEADGFLYNMVRNIVGTLVEVGRGKQPPEWIDEVMAARDRHAAGQTAPAKGLFLLRVDYRPFPPNGA
jgi:tRNA pseudouridine38-40 synthase